MRSPAVNLLHRFRTAATLSSRCLVTQRAAQYHSATCHPAPASTWDRLVPARSHGTLSGQSPGLVPPRQSGSSIVEPLAAGLPATTQEINPLAGAPRPGTRGFAQAVGAAAISLAALQNRTALARMPAGSCRSQGRCTCSTKTVQCWGQNQRESTACL